MWRQGDTCEIPNKRNNPEKIIIIIIIIIVIMMIKEQIN